jgi:uncharacterized membrane protein YjdF
MVDAAIAPANKAALRTLEFYAFCVVSFAGKSMLLIRLPYREWPVNTLYTCSLLLFFYVYFRFRQQMIAPLFIVSCLAGAVAVDVLGNKLGLYGNPFGPLRDYDEFAHFAGSGLSAVAAFWLLRAGTRRLGFKLSAGLQTFLATTVAFTYCGWYEILELWDELFYGDFERIHTLDDTANDLFYDFLGVIAFVLAAGLFFHLKDRRAGKDADNDRSSLLPVRLKTLLDEFPKDLLAFFIVTVAFSLCSWFEIFRMFDQRWFGRIHLVHNRDTPTYLQYELVGSIALAIGYVLIAKIRAPRLREKIERSNL